MSGIRCCYSGACTAGTYFSNLLGKAGLKVLVIDKDSEESLCKRLDIIHFTRDSYEEFAVEESKEGDEDFVHNFEVCYSKSALDRHLKTNYLKVAVLHLPLFIKKLRKKALENQVEFRFGVCFDHLLYDKNKYVVVDTHCSQVYGRFDGVIETENGPKKFRNVMAFIEHAVNRW